MAVCAHVILLRLPCLRKNVFRKQSCYCFAAAMRSALTAALSGKLNDRIQPDEAQKNDAFSFPCLSGPEKPDGRDDAAAFERLSLADAALLAGSAPNAVHLADGSLAVRSVYVCKSGRKFEAP